MLFGKILNETGKTKLAFAVQTVRSEALDASAFDVGIDFIRVAFETMISLQLL